MSNTHTAFSTQKPPRLASTTYITSNMASCTTRRKLPSEGRCGSGCVMAILVTLQAYVLPFMVPG